MTVIHGEVIAMKLSNQWNFNYCGFFKMFSVEKVLEHAFKARFEYCVEIKSVVIEIVEHETRQCFEEEFYFYLPVGYPISRLVFDSFIGVEITVIHAKQSDYVREILRELASIKPKAIHAFVESRYFYYENGSWSEPLKRLIGVV